MILDRDPSASVVSRREMLRAAVVGTSALAIPAASVANSQPQPGFPPPLQEAIKTELAHLRHLGMCVAEVIRKDDPRWQCELAGFQEFIAEESRFRVAPSPDWGAYVGYPESRSDWSKRVCVLFLPEGLAPLREVEMLAWGLAYHWRDPDNTCFHAPSPSIFGHNQMDMARASALLSGMSGREWVIHT